MDAKTLSQAAGCSKIRATSWLPHICSAMDRYQINTKGRQAAFLAQVAHESCRLLFVREIWNPAQCPWQAHYEGRADLGNTQPGDGKRFMGRGLLQVTGRANYAAVAAALGLPLLDHPELLEQPEHASASAAWFWFSHGLNSLADNGDFIGITRRINGGTNGLQERTALFLNAQRALA